MCMGFVQKKTQLTISSKFMPILFFFFFFDMRQVLRLKTKTNKDSLALEPLASYEARTTIFGLNTILILLPDPEILSRSLTFFRIVSSQCGGIAPRHFCCLCQKKSLTTIAKSRMKPLDYSAKIKIIIIIMFYVY